MPSSLTRRTPNPHQIPVAKLALKCISFKITPKVIDEAYSEGRKFFHLKHSSSKGNIGSSSGSASGSGSSVEQGGKHSKDQHHDILRQAYKEGQKLFHYHAKHGVSGSTSQNKEHRHLRMLVPVSVQVQVQVLLVLLLVLVLQNTFHST